MGEKELQQQAVFGDMTEADWEEFYAKSEDEQDAFADAFADGADETDDFDDFV